MQFSWHQPKPKIKSFDSVGGCSNSAHVMLLQIKFGLIFAKKSQCKKFLLERMLQLNLPVPGLKCLVYFIYITENNYIRKNHFFLIKSIQRHYMMILSKTFTQTGW